MAKSILDLPLEPDPEIGDIVYIATDFTTLDKRITLQALLTIREDRAVIYDAVSAITLSSTVQTLKAATKVAINAKGFTVDEATGLFTFNTDGVGKLYKIDFNFVIPKGTLDGEEVYAQVNYESATKVLGVSYVGTDSVYASVSGSSLFVVNNSGDTVSIEVGATATSSSQTPVEVNIVLDRAYHAP